MAREARASLTTKLQQMTSHRIVHSLEAYLKGSVKLETECHKHTLECECRHTDSDSADPASKTQEEEAEALNPNTEQRTSERDTTAQAETTGNFPEDSN